MSRQLAALSELEDRLRIVGIEPTQTRVDTLNELGMALRGTEQFDRMQTLALEAATIARSIPYPAGEGRALAMLAFVQYIRSDLKSALANSMQALRLATGDTKSEAQIRVVLALVQWTLGNFDEALRHLDRSIPVLSGSDDKITEGFAFTAKGGVLHSLAQYDLALACHRDALELFRAEGYEIGVARALAGLGSAYQALGLVTAALECHRDSLKIAEREGHAISISRALTDIGQVHEEQGRLAEALDCHERALMIREQGKYVQPQTTNLLCLGRIHLKLGNLEQAREYLHQGLVIAEEIGTRPKTIDFHQQISNIYEQTGDLAQSLRHYKEYERIKAELYSDQATLRHKAIELESQLEIHRLRNFELANLLEQLQATQAELLNREKMAALGSLVAALAHELNSPLGVIQSASDVTLRCADKLAAAPESQGAIEVLRTNARLVLDASQRISKLVTSLKNFAHLDRAEFAQYDIVQSIEHTLALLEPEFRGRVTIERDYQRVPKINCYGAELNQIFMNLLRNAAQAIDGEGQIRISTECEEEHIRIHFTDTGRGMTREKIDAIFHPGFTRDGTRVRAALSLFGCLNAARKHGGNIEVESEPGKGSTFTVALPRTLENAPEPLRGALS